MLLGLGVVGASADNALDNYTDADDIGDAYLEAVGVLTGLGVVDGMTDTTIVPQATYTRAQAAKIIATMVLGVDGAKTCVATTNPFDDVDANHWAAGYIAFCKEEGIIDGVTDTSFDPEGTLTGYQWAKMLLAAVGFNANNELEGASWSLNTARIGHEVGLFNGDTSAADHTPLRREQAMLFAFNALTSVRQVTYSADATNYVYGIKGYIFADGTGKTLGDKVFNLKSVEGQIIDNEGMGNANTIVDNIDHSRYAEAEVTIDANTGLDLMYHAVRVWYIDGKTNTGVYVNDLAKVTEYDCMHAYLNGSDSEADKAVAKLKNVETKSIGDTTETKYERYVIDNTALDLKYDYADVTLYADYTTLGYAGKNNTDIGTVAVDNDHIVTDISDIAYGAGIIAVHATATETGNDGYAWHVYPVTATEGVIKSAQQSDGKVYSYTLTDGTVLELSNLFTDANVDNIVVGRNYKFVLDTHGDIITITKDYARDLYVYTGEGKYMGSYNDWNVDQVYSRRFINVTTGEELTVPVVASNSLTMQRGQYYDITASANNKGLYVATLVTAASNPYTEQYAIGTYTFDSKSTSSSYTYATSKSGTVYFNPNTITFLVATGSGANMEVKPYTGISGLKEALGVALNGTVELTNAVFTVSDTLTGNAKYATVCFVLYENVKTTSNYVFIPNAVGPNDWDQQYSDDLMTYKYVYSGAYLAGEKITVTFTESQKNELINDGFLTRGFYTYTTVYENGELTYKLDKKVANGTDGCYYDQVTYEATTTDGTGVWVLYGNGTSYTADENTKVIDTTGNEIDSLVELWRYNQKNQGKASIAFTVYDGDVDYIYVVADGTLNTVTFVNGLGTNWSFVGSNVFNDVTNGQPYSVTLKYTGHTYSAGDTLHFTVNGEDKEIKADANGNFVITWTASRVDNGDDVKVNISAVYAVAKFAVEKSGDADPNNADLYTAGNDAKVGIGSTTSTTYTRNGVDKTGTVTYTVNGYTGTATFDDGFTVSGLGPVFCDTTFTLSYVSNIA